MVRLDPMTETDFHEYLASAVENYAAEKVKAGTWLEAEATEKARQVFARLLPNGKDTENHHLFRVVDDLDDRKIGYFWYNVQERPIGREAFIYDIVLFEAERGKGFGKQAMLNAEAHAKAHGVEKIALHAFGHNKRAIALYEKIGYITTDVVMAKEIR